jgi:DNA-binding NarL/FixJ family response regulator
MKTRIVLVDDHQMFREGLSALIGSRTELEIVGSAANGKDALSLVGDLSPDIVIMDVGMPEMNGIETVRQMKRLFPDIQVLALSAHHEHHIILDMLRAGATGYVLKESSFDELVAAIHSLMQNRIFISSLVSSSLIMEFAHNSAMITGSAYSLLTSRELEILQAVAEGKSTKEIAQTLSISVKTVETHRQQLMDKLDMHSIAELTKYAIREEITPV